MILRPMLVGLAGRQGSRPDGRRELSVMRRCRSKNAQISSGALMSWFLGPAISEDLFNRVSSLLLAPMRSPALLALIATGAAGVLVLAYHRQGLPEVVASHFGASGAANGWMPRDTHVLLAQGLFVFLTATFCLMGWIMSRIPAKWVNLPNKGYWFAAEREADTRRHLSGWGYGFGAVVNLFLIFAFRLVYRANLSDPVAFDSTSMTVGLVAFVIAIIGSTIVLLLRYGRTV